MTRSESPLRASVMETKPTGGQDRSSLAYSEEDRLAVLALHMPMQAEDDPELETIVEFAAQLAGCPTALVSLVDSSKQRFVARCGLEDKETPRSHSFCQYAMLETKVMEVLDATQDPRFRTNPLVVGKPFIRFYAGAPIVSDEGLPLGSLCVISPEARTAPLNNFQHDGLMVMAKAAMRRLKHLGRIGK